jgi:Protein of unknown function (DUF3551)
MRSVRTFLVLTGAALIAGMQAGHAQSAYDYPWCAIYTNRSGAQACYFASYEQCMATMSGISGTCIHSPYYRGPQRPERHTRRTDPARSRWEAQP